MSKKTKLWLVLPVFALALFLVFNQLQNHRNKKDRIFCLNKNFRVDRILISQNGNSCELNYRQGKWMTDSVNPTDPNKIKLAFSALTNLKMNYPASKNFQDLLRDSINRKGVQITLSNNSKKIYTLNFLSTNNQNMVLSKRNHVYFAVVPEYPYLNLNEIINADPKYWSANIIMRWEQKQISEIAVKHAFTPLHDFRILQSDNRVKLYNQQNNPVAQFDSLTVHDYLQFFTGIKYRNWNKDSYSFNKQSHLYTLEILPKGKPLFNIRINSLTQTGSNTPEMNFCAGIINQNDTVILSYNDIDPYLVKLEYFLKK